MTTTPLSASLSLSSSIAVSHFFHRHWPSSMTSYIKFTPISGAKNENPLCYLLEIDEVKILLDCGWSDTFDTQDLANLKKWDPTNPFQYNTDLFTFHSRVAKQIDAVLISHCDLNHLGALPYARSQLGMTCPVYATLPVVNMGKMCMYDLHQSKTNEMEFNTFSLESIDEAFERITSLRYSQPYALSGKWMHSVLDVPVSHIYV